MSSASTAAPMHSAAFRRRRALNWLPLGLTYAFLYMARYNLTVSKNALGNLMSKEAFGIIFATGAVTYAFSFLINGPLTDRMGGKKAMLISAVGSALMNVLMGAILYGILVYHWSLDLTLTFSVVYALNMYFQSYGAVAIVKVNAAWFHVRERGIFAGIFGTLISLGLYFAYDWSEGIVEYTEKRNPGAPEYWLVFLIPAAILIFWTLIDIFFLRDSPRLAGYEDFDTGDASSGEAESPLSLGEVLRRILTNRIILTVGAIEFCTGVLRDGVRQWFVIFAKEQMTASPGDAAGWLFWLNNSGKVQAAVGVAGGMIAGWMSDKLFGSRRAPAAGVMYICLILGVAGMSFTVYAGPLVLGSLVAWISIAVIGTHGLLSGTATMDFGGRKAAATATGMIDGLVYLGTGVQALSLGWITTWNWGFWPFFLIPFSLIGLYLTTRIWQAIPAGATRKG